MLFGKRNTTLPDGIEELICRKVDDGYGRCSNTRHDEYDQYENKRASNGHTSLDYNAYHQMQQELLTKHGDLTWSAMKEVLDAHDIEYFPELQDQLNQIAESILPASFTRPWHHPAGYERNSLLSSEEIDGRKRYELENARASSLHTVSNDIELWEPRKMPFFAQSISSC